MYLVLTILTLLVSYELNSVSPFLKGLNLAFQGLYFIYAYGIRRRKLRLDKPLIAALVFVTWYALFFFLRRYDIATGIASAIYFILIPLNVKASKITLSTPSLSWSLFWVYIIGFIVPALISPSFQFSVGANYNLRNVLFYNSTLDIHLFGVLTLMVSYLNNKRFVTLLTLALVLLIFFTYGRRGPYFNVLVLVAIAIGVKGMVKYYGIRLLGLTFWSLPFFWSTISFLLVSALTSDFISDLIPRNNVEEYETATGRMVVWLNALDYLSKNVGLQWLWGYGDSFRLGITYVLTHMHNVIFELFFQAGIVGIFLLFNLLWKTYSASDTKYWIIISWIMMLGATESIIFGYNLTSIIFIIVMCLAPNREVLPSVKDVTSGHA